MHCSHRHVVSRVAHASCNSSTAEHSSHIINKILQHTFVNSKASRIACRHPTSHRSLGRPPLVCIPCSQPHLVHSLVKSHQNLTLHTRAVTALRSSFHPTSPSILIRCPLSYRNLVGMAGTGGTPDIDPPICMFMGRGGGGIAR